MKVLKWIFIVLTVVGSLNWGLVGLFNFDLVAFLFGRMSLVSCLIYVIIGISGVVVFISQLKKSSAV
jgi:uncharacterized protein